MPQNRMYEANLYLEYTRQQKLQNSMLATCDHLLPLNIMWKASCHLQIFSMNQLPFKTSFRIASSESGPRNQNLGILRRTSEIQSLWIMPLHECHFKWLMWSLMGDSSVNFPFFTLFERTRQTCKCLQIMITCTNTTIEQNSMCCFFQYPK